MGPVDKSYRVIRREGYIHQSESDIRRSAIRKAGAVPGGVVAAQMNIPFPSI